MLEVRTDQIIACLLIAIICFLPVLTVMLWNKRRLVVREADNIEIGYFIRYSAFHQIVSAIVAIGFYGMTVMALITLDGELLAVGIFLAGVVLGNFAWLIAILWEIRVDNETLTFYRFPLPPKQIRFGEITSVRVLRKLARSSTEGQIHLVGFCGGKKLFDIDGDMINSGRLFQQFQEQRHLEWAFQKEYGKVEISQVREEFFLTETMANKARAVFGFLLGAGLTAGLLICFEQLRQEEPDFAVIYVSGSLLFLVLGIEELLKAMLWRLTVNYRTIWVRSALGRTFSFRFEDIKALEEKEHYILLYVGERKPVKVWKNLTNYALFEERLRRELNSVNAS